MKAFYQTSYTGPDASKYGFLPDPVPDKEKLLIEVKAVSINPVDYKIKRGDLRMISGSKFPKIVGSDFAGIVKEVGADIQNFKPGDRVYGALPILFGKAGALCELISIEPKYARLIPEGISLEEAASLPVAALTALNGLRNCGVSAGKQVLINGATGGVGHFAIQIAKARGAVVTATCSQSNAELAKRLGADETTGYKREDLARTKNKFDLILDAYGKMQFEDVCRLLKKNGVYASTMPTRTSFFSAFFVKLIYGKKLTSANLRTNPEDFAEIEKLFSEKKLNPVIENTFPLEKAAEAFELAEKGKPRGKIIITI
jgi:NADPH:quinone reductase-like Zn-dependent oxidoreductase